MKCPGQDSRLWGPEAIFESKCPGCGAPVEFFKDESSRKCRSCGRKVLNPKMDFGCAAYCRFAAECLGELPPELVAKRAEMLKDRVAAEVKKALGRDFKKIARALKVAEHSLQIQREEGGDPAVVTLAAYLSPIAAIGAGGCESASDILSRAGTPYGLAGEVLAILESSGGAPSVNFKCVHDGGRLADLEEALKAEAGGAQTAMPEFLTDSGRRIASRVLAETGRRANTVKQ